MPRIRLALFTLLATLVLGPCVATAAPGEPVRTFGSGGQVTSGYGLSDLRIVGTSTQWFSDGSLLLSSNGGERTVLSRYDSDGRLDESFGEEGFALVPNHAGRREFAVQQVFPSSDGQIGFFGLDGTFGGRIVFGRLDETGELDHSFGKKGFRWGPRFGDPWASSYDDQGRLLISDRTFNDRPDRLYRFDSAGKRDPSFGTNGVVKYFHTGNNSGIDRLYPTDTGVFITDRNRIIRLDSSGEVDLGFGQEGEVRGLRYHLAIDSSDRLIVIRNGKVTRLLPGGDPDPGFGPSGDGQVSPGGSIDDYISLPDGSTVLKIKDEKLEQDGLLRLNPDGSFDQDFGTEGFLPLSGPSFGLNRGPGTGVHLTEASDSKTFIHQLDSTGLPVATFGENGRLEVRVKAPSDDRLSEAARRRDGSILLAGISDHGLLLQSFTRAGKLEKTFGSQGSLQLAPLNSKTRSSVPKLALAPNGSGFVCAKSDGKSSLWKVTRGGQPEGTFGDGGVVVLPGTESCRDLTFDGSGVIVAYENPSTRDLDLARYRADGTIDRSYGQSGKALIPIKYGISGYDDALLTTDRRGRTILLAEDEGIVLLRFLGDGMPDKSFGNGGFVRFVAKPAPKSKKTKLNLALFWSLAMDGTGKILIGGSTKEGPVIARIGRTGKPDRKFGRSGVVSLPVPDTKKKRRYRDQVLGMTRQQDGKLVVVGQSEPKCHRSFDICPQPMFIYRLTDRGKLDQAFSKQSMKSAWTPGDSRGVAVFADKKGITVARTVNTSEGRNDFSLFRVQR